MDRDYYHMLLDESMDQTPEGSSFLGCFVDRVILGLLAREMKVPDSQIHDCGYGIDTLRSIIIDLLDGNTENDIIANTGMPLDRAREIMQFFAEIEKDRN